MKTSWMKAVPVLMLGVALWSGTARVNAATATIFTNGAWVQVTQGSGTDDITYAIVTDVKHSDGSITEYTSSWFAGTYNDHGGPDNQEVAHGTLKTVDLQPGDSATTVIAMYAKSNGTWLDTALQGLRDVLSGIGTVADVSPLVGALLQGGAVAAQAIDDSLVQADQDQYAGAVEIDTWCNSDGSTGWNSKPLQGAVDRGVNDASTNEYRMDFHQHRGEYWFKYGVHF